MNEAIAYIQYYMLTLNSPELWCVSQRRPTIVPHSLKKSTIVSSSILYDKFPAYSFLQLAGLGVASLRGGRPPPVLLLLEAPPLDDDAPPEGGPLLLPPLFIGGHLSPGRGGQKYIFSGLQFQQKKRFHNNFIQVHIIKIIFPVQYIGLFRR